MVHARAHYDQLGDETSVASSEANATNQNRSKETKVKSRGDDELKLGKDKVIERGITVFSNRFPHTNSIKKKIKE